MRVNGFVRAIIHYVKRRGLTAALGEARRRYVAGRQHWNVTRDGVARWLDTPLDADGLEYRLARPEDLDRMHLFTRQEPATLRAWYRPGYLFFLALDAGVPVAYRCLGPAVEGWASRYVTLRPDEVFVVDLFVAPAYRGRHVPRRLGIAMAPALAERGIRDVIGIQRGDNHNVFHSGHSRGLEFRSVLTRTTFLGITKVTLT
jgi:GNAT superfamily N-acetyltransferase